MVAYIECKLEDFPVIIFWHEQFYGYRFNLILLFILFGEIDKGSALSFLDFVPRHYPLALTSLE